MIKRLFFLVLIALSPLTGLLAGREAVAAETPAPSPVSETYIIGPGDVLQVFVWRNADLSVTVPVRPDGRITTPLAEDMVAAGKTAAQLARDMEGVLAEYVKSPQVNIIVAAAASVLNQVRVIGQVRNPKGVPYVDGMTVLDVILAVGGLGEYASGNQAKVVRKVNGKDNELKVKLKDIEEGDLRTNFAVKPGDIVVVPQSLF